MDRIKKTVGISKENTNIENLINILMLINMVIIGGDRLSFELAGMTIRFVQITLFLTFILMWKEKRIIFEKALWFIPFLIANVISTVFSEYFKTGITYIIWTIYNYILSFVYFILGVRIKAKNGLLISGWQVL